MAILEKDRLAHFPDARMIEPMLINKIPKGKEDRLAELCEGGEYFAQTKKDGYLYIYEKTNENVYLFSRNKSRTNGCLNNKIDNVPHIREAFDSLPAGTIILGEVYIPDKTSKDVTTIMGCLPAKAIERQNATAPIKYYVYDILSLDGEDLCGKGAESRFNTLVEVCEKYDLLKEDYIELSDYHTEDIQSKIVASLANGEEGMVMKRKDGQYTPGKRPAWVTLKIKQSDTTDAVICGFCEPTKEYNGTELDSWQYWEGDIPVTKHYYFGWKNAIEVGAYDENNNLQVIGTISSGLNDELRAAFAESPDDYLGQVCEIECMSLDSDACTIRHGFFKGFREDKDQYSCTLRHIFGGSK